MKSVLNIVAAVLIAAGFVVAVASLLTPGQVILGIDFKLAATLVVGGLILHALARALTLLERMSNDLRQMRKAGNEAPPWLRQAAGQAGVQSVAAPAMAQAAAAETTAAVRQDASPEPEEDVGRHFGGQPAAAEPDWRRPSEEDWPTVSEVQWPQAPEPEAPQPEAQEAPQAREAPAPAARDEDHESPFLGAPPPAPEPEPEPQPEAEPQPEPEPEYGFIPEPEHEPEPWHEPKPEPSAEQTMSPDEAAVAEEAETTGEPELAEAELEKRPEERDEVASRSEPAEADPGEQPDAASEPEPTEPLVQDHAETPRRLKPSQEPVESAQAPQVQEDAPETSELYVVEERMFRGKQARVLSDGTIEAETADGWMRFEDFDHLEEYLDAMADLGR